MHETVSLLHGAALSLAAFSRQSAAWKNNVLGVLCFSDDAAGATAAADLAGPPMTGTSAPHLRVPMQRLAGENSACEVWRSGNVLTPGRHGAIHYIHDDELLFGVITLAENLFKTRAGKTPLQQAAESIYDQVFGLLDALHFPHVLRFWNYFADINADSFGMERYRQFNLGRQASFVTCGRHELGIFPAACALGAGAGPLNVAFLAGRVAPLNIENPRQISAYHYPQQYGPRSPMFSRASLARLKHELVLFISGTASIVGHTTLHAGDVLAQTRETMANIEAVLAEANRLRLAHQPGFANFNLSDLHYKVYVRDPLDLPTIRDELQRCMGDALQAVYLQADVCRQELMLEIEACAAQPLVRATHHA
jgi:enamine deaminase RidA (YjgF/YER057c/UK114 family)